MAEEEAAAALETAADESVGLSVDALESLTIDDVVEEFEEDEEEFEEEEEEEEADPAMAELLAGLPNLAPDAGKIRFAEDIVGDFRGGGNRRRRRRRQPSGRQCSGRPRTRAAPPVSRAGLLPIHPCPTPCFVQVIANSETAPHPRTQLHRLREQKSLKAI